MTGEDSTQHWFLALTQHNMSRGASLEGAGGWLQVSALHWAAHGHATRTLALLGTRTPGVGESYHT